MRSPKKSFNPFLDLFLFVPQTGSHPSPRHSIAANDSRILWKSSAYAPFGDIDGILPRLRTILASPATPARPTLSFHPRRRPLKSASWLARSACPSELQA